MGLGMICNTTKSGGGAVVLQVVQNTPMIRALHHCNTTPPPYGGRWGGVASRGAFGLDQREVVQRWCKMSFLAARSSS